MSISAAPSSCRAPSVSAFLSLLAACSSPQQRALLQSQELLFTASPRLSTFACTSLISAYARHGFPHEAIRLYEVLMQEHRVPPNAYTLVSLLKACGLLPDLARGLLFHSMAVELGEDRSNPFVANTLVSMYGRCGSLPEAEHSFDPSAGSADVVAWNAIISANLDSGRIAEAWILYVRMQEEGFAPDRPTFLAMLRACSDLVDAEPTMPWAPNAEKLVVEIVCEMWRIARRHDRVLLSSPPRCCFSVMMKRGPKETCQPLYSPFKHASSFFRTRRNPYPCSGAIEEAEHVFCASSFHEPACWNSLLSAYVDQGEGERALHLYAHMHEEGVSPDIQTYVIAFQACSRLAETEKATCVGGRYVKLVPLEIAGALQTDTRAKGFVCEDHLGNIMVSAYGKCGAISEAEEFFCGLSQRSVVSWSSMMLGYVESDDGEKALKLYRQMQNEAPDCLDALACVVALQACVCLAGKEGMLLAGCSEKSIGLEIGQALHSCVCRKGFASDVLVGSTLVTMYSKCGMVTQAESMFSELVSESMTNVSWTVMLSMYVEHNKPKKALLLYAKMQNEEHDPEEVTMTLVLQACSILAEEEAGNPQHRISLEIGRALHADAERVGLTSDATVQSGLIAMYAKCGSIVHAENVFFSMPTQVVTPWNAILAAYLRYGFEENAFCLYKQMLLDHIALNESSVTGLLQTTDAVGSLEMCRKLHFDIVCAGHNDSPSLSSSLLFTYGSCASTGDARCCFDELQRPDIVSWNACISGYTREGNVVASLGMFELLKLSTVRPNEVSFLSIFSACGHAGLVESGLEYFISMRGYHGVNVDVKHYGSILDLLARTGDYKRIQSVLEAMPIEANQPIWLSLLASCRTHGNLAMAQNTFFNAVGLDPTEASQYILMSKMIYADIELSQSIV